MDQQGVLFQRVPTPEHPSAVFAFVARRNVRTGQQVSGQVRFVSECFRTLMAFVLRSHAAFFLQMPYKIVPFFVASTAHVRANVPSAERTNCKKNSTQTNEFFLMRREHEEKRREEIWRCEVKRKSFQR